MWGYIGADKDLREVAGDHDGLLSRDLEEMLKGEFTNHGQASTDRNTKKDIINPIMEKECADDITDPRGTDAAQEINGDDKEKFKRFADKHKRQYLPHQPARLQCANAIGRVGILKYFYKLIGPKAVLMLKLTVGW